MRVALLAMVLFAPSHTFALFARDYKRKAANYASL